MRLPRWHFLRRLRHPWLLLFSDEHCHPTFQPLLRAHAYNRPNPVLIHSIDKFTVLSATESLRTPLLNFLSVNCWPGCHGSSHGHIKSTRVTIRYSNNYKSISFCTICDCSESLFSSIFALFGFSTTHQNITLTSIPPTLSACKPFSIAASRDLQVCRWEHLLCQGRLRSCRALQAVAWDSLCSLDTK